MSRPRRLALLLVLTLLLAGCTDDAESDADGDGLRDRVERGEREINVRDVNGTETVRTVTSDADARDTDGDGLEDLDEFVRGTDPRDVDTDGDGLLDGHGLTPEADVAAAWRARGILENPRGAFLGELDQCPAYGGLKSADASSDRPLADNLSDGEEIRGWSISIRGNASFHVTSDPCVGDTDGDGLLDHLEKALGSHPRERDSDGDGITDVGDADPVWNVSLRIEGVRVVREGNRTTALSFSTADEVRTLSVPGNDSLTLDVRDQSPNPSSLQAPLILSAVDPLTGEPVALFEDERGVILTLDLLKGTISSGEGESVTASFTSEGADGSLSFTWRADRT